MPDHVYFKATKDSIIVMLDNTPDFNEIKASLKSKVAEARRFFGNSSTTITFKGRDLSANEQTELVNIISDGTDLNIATVVKMYESVDTGLPFKKLFTQTIPRAQSVTTNNTVFHKGSLRSGMSIEHSGSVVVLGDINPGGEIVAGGNIIVLGTLKGMAHAGAFGDDTCYVAAISLQPTQLRIANIITSVAEELNKNNKQLYSPSYAYIQNDQIYIAPLV